jgi:twinkle protein
MGCGHWEPPTDGTYERKETRISTPKEFKTGIYADLDDRGLTRETLEKWGYQVNVDEKCHIANYRDASGELVAQKIRRAGKKFQVHQRQQGHAPLRHVARSGRPQRRHRGGRD